MWLNVLVAVLAGISSGAISLTDILDPVTAHKIVAWTTFLVAVIAVANVGLHGMSTPNRGPLLKYLEADPKGTNVE
jgi:uncharacterized membrane protein (DUF441 family)